MSQGLDFALDFRRMLAKMERETQSHFCLSGLPDFAEGCRGFPAKQFVYRTADRLGVYTNNMLAYLCEVVSCEDVAHSKQSHKRLFAYTKEKRQFRLCIR